MATTNPPTQSSLNLAAGVAGSAAGTGSPPPPKYIFNKPARQRLTLAGRIARVGRSLKVLLYLLRHTLGSFAAMPTAAAPLTLSEPAGDISEEMLKVCEHLAGDAEARLTKLETKATGLLGLIALVAPLIASAAVFIRQHSLPPFPNVSTLTLNLAAMLFLALGLCAALRALAVRGQESLFLNAVVDPAKDVVRPYTPDFFGRGLLHVAAARQAICDHLADFVRAAQVFLVLGVLLAATAAGVVLFQVHEDTQTVQGTIGLDTPTLSAIQHSVESVNQAAATRLDHIESELATLRQSQSNTQTAARLEHLTQEVAELRKQVAARAVAKPHSSGRTRSTH